MDQDVTYQPEMWWDPYRKAYCVSLRGLIRTITDAALKAAPARWRWVPDPGRGPLAVRQALCNPMDDVLPEVLSAMVALSMPVHDPPMF